MILQHNLRHEQSRRAVASSVSSAAATSGDFLLLGGLRLLFGLLRPRQPLSDRILPESDESVLLFIDPDESEESEESWSD